jgi:hypothetical protein
MCVGLPKAAEHLLLAALFPACRQTGLFLSFGQTKERKATIMLRDRGHLSFYCPKDSFGAE